MPGPRRDLKRDQNPYIAPTSWSAKSSGPFWLDQSGSVRERDVSDPIPDKFLDSYISSYEDKMKRNGSDRLGSMANKLLLDNYLPTVRLRNNLDEQRAMIKALRSKDE
jgi:hypothetical protein